MKCKLFIPLLLIGLITIANHGRGQGYAFTYQGILKQDGFTAYGIYDFYFAAYGSETGGGPVSPSAFVNGVLVSNGLFTVTIDLGSGAFNSAPRWLQIGVKTNASLDPYAILAPRQQLTPAPYAIYAGNATSANLVPWSGLQSVPAGFADGIDNDTTYTAGTGLLLSSTTFSLNTGFTDALYWRLGGNAIAPGQFLGTVNNQPLDIRVNNVRALRLEPNLAGPPNLIGGAAGNSIASGVSGATIGGGIFNSIEANSQMATLDGGTGNAVLSDSPSAVIGGGDRNTVQGYASTVSGGAGNSAISQRSTVGGGSVNNAVGDTSFIGGGSWNYAWNGHSAVVAGFSNVNGGAYGIIGGGEWNRISSGGRQAGIFAGTNNTVNGHAGFVGGGRSNIIDNAEYVVIGGGERNRANYPWVVIGGGDGNVADGFHATIAGGRNNQTGEQGAFIGGGSNNDASGHHSTIAGGSANIANASGSTISGGSANAAYGTRSVIGGGERNSAESEHSTIAGGTFNRTEGLSAGATIGGGRSNNIASAASHSTIGGGFSNRVEAFGAVIAGGVRNTVDVEAQWASIGGGFGNVVDNDMAAIAGGWNNTNRSSRAFIGAGHLNLIDYNSESATISGGYSNYIQRFARYGTIPGGDRNVVWDEYGFAAGHRAKSYNRGAFVWGDSTDADHESSRDNQFSIRANGGVTIQSTNIALELTGGGSVKVPGAGVGSSTPVFIHRATAANIAGNYTTIDHPHCNGDPNAVLIVTPNWNPGGVGGTYNNHAIGVYYTGAKWAIFNQDLAAMPANAAFNVLVVKP